ncbi:MAG: DUF366 family protein [Planctomycetes bacterium]|nr:DUF366 family protein [Planctomycetota bacterium]MBI3844636.1 DUF366 family protein [Planctomycetota bacterium]
MTVATRVLRRELAYTGAELHSHFALRLLGIEGDSAIAFLGPCNVSRDSMVDLVDLRAGSIIRGNLMLHLIVEHFDPNLHSAVLRQRLLAAIARDLLAERAPRATIERQGDDLYLRRRSTRRKLSISVATVSPVSLLVHFALNVDAAGAPVAAAGLDDLGIEPRAFARELLRRYAGEMASVESAAVTVRPVP